MKSYCHPDLNNLPTEQAPTLKENKESLYDQSPQVEKQRESKFVKPKAKQQVSTIKRNSKIYFKTFSLRFRSPDKMFPPFKQPFQTKIRVKRTEKEMDSLKRFLFQKNS